MARKRYSDEDVLKLLREIDVHLHDCLGHIIGQVGAPSALRRLELQAYGLARGSHLSNHPLHPLRCGGDRVHVINPHEKNHLQVAHLEAWTFGLPPLRQRPETPAQR